MAYDVMCTVIRPAADSDTLAVPASGRPKRPPISLGEHKHSGA